MAVPQAERTIVTVASEKFERCLIRRENEKTVI